MAAAMKVCDCKSTCHSRAFSINFELSNLNVWTIETVYNE